MRLLLAAAAAALALLALPGTARAQMQLKTPNGQLALGVVPLGCYLTQGTDVVFVPCTTAGSTPVPGLGGSSGGGSYTLPIATTAVLGGIIPDGTTIQVNSSTGVASVIGGGGSALAVGTSTLTGSTSGSILYANAGVLANETLASLLLAPPAIGGGTPGPGAFSTLTSGGNTVLTPSNLPVASTTTLGALKVDGTTITVNGSGVASAAGGGGGTITGITGGTGITASTSSGNVTLSLTVPVTPANGGTGVNNGASTITLGGALVTSGANPVTLTTTGTTNVTLPTSGTLSTLAIGTAAGTARDAAAAITAETGANTAATLAAAQNGVNASAYLLCDGSTDNATRIANWQAAIVASPTKTGFIPPQGAACLTSGNLAVVSGETIWAVPGTVTFKPTLTSAASPLLFNAAYVSNVLVYGVVFDGNTGGGATLTANLTQWYSVTNVIFDHVALQNSYGQGLQASTAIVRSGMKDGWITNVGVTNHVQGASFTSGTGNIGNFFKSNTVTLTGLDALNLANQTDFVANANIFESVGGTSGLGGACIYGASMSNWTVVGNECVSAYGNGIDGIYVTGFTIAANHVRLSGHAGIQVSSSSAGLIGDNTILNNNQIGATGTNNILDGGITLGGPNAHIVIAGNTATDNQTVHTQQYGLEWNTGVTTNCVLCTVSTDNDFSGNVVAAFGGGANFTSQPPPAVVPNTFSVAADMPNMVASASPTVCVTGDSTSTLTPSELVPNDILYYGLTRRLREDNPTKTFSFANYGIGSQTWNALNAVASTFPSWYFDPTLPWLPYIQAQNCTSIFIALGVNDQAGFTPSAVQSVLSKVVGWGTAPSTWAASNAYAAGAVMLDSNGKLEIVKTAGTSGSGAHPTWPSTVGAATTDGGVTWELLSASAYVAQVPDIVLLTNQNANPTAVSPFNTPAVIIGTVAAASYERTLALGGANATSFGIPGLPLIGLIDVGRMFSEVYNGIDPVEPIFVQSITTPTAAITAFPYSLPTTPGGDFDLTFVVANGSAYTGSSYIQVATGSDDGVTETYLTLLPVSSANALASFVNNATGVGGGAGSVSSYNGTVWATGSNTIEVSAKGTHLLVSVNGVIVIDVITARFVASFAPVIQFVNPPSSPSVIVNAYNVSVPRLVSPTVSGLDCWGPGVSGGNGINHDASPCMQAVYMAVLDATRFGAVAPATQAATSTEQIFTASGSFVIATRSSMICHLDVGAGGGAGGGGVIAAGGSGSGGAGGGAGTMQGPICKPASSYTSPVTVTVGTGGAGGASGANGSSGSLTQFGTDAAAFAGAGGGYGASGQVSAGGKGSSSNTTPGASNGPTQGSGGQFQAGGGVGVAGAAGFSGFALTTGTSGSGGGATGAGYGVVNTLNTPSGGASGGGFASSVQQAGGGGNYTGLANNTGGAANTSGVGGAGATGSGAFPFATYATAGSSGGGAGTTTGGAGGGCPTGGAGMGGSGGGAGTTAGGAGAAGCPGAMMVWQY